MPALISQIAPDKIKEGKKPEDGLLRKIFKKVSLQTRDVVRVDGLEDLLVSFAKCCFPIQGDPIVGFVTRGRGVTIHRVDCPKVPAIDPERRVNAAWNMNVDLIRTARIRITCEDKTGMLADITKAISDKKINITKAVVRTTRDLKALIALDVGAPHLSELHSIMKAVEKIDGVISVERELS